MKLFVKKTATKNATFTAINKAALKQVKGGGKYEHNDRSTDLD